MDAAADDVIDRLEHPDRGVFSDYCRWGRRMSIVMAEMAHNVAVGDA